MFVEISKFEEELRRKDPKSGAYLDSMLSRFNQEVQKAGLFREIKRREFYVKPSVIKSKKKKNKQIKISQQRRENALRNANLQRGFGQRTKRTDNRSEVNKRR